MPDKKIPVNYTIRPCKQIERRLIIERLIECRSHAIDVSRYQYIGFGSIFYYDFVMFHKYLKIKNMRCFEERDIPRRMEFNKPYDFIKIDIGPIANYATELFVDKNPKMYWLDFEDPLTIDSMELAKRICNNTSVDDVFIISINAAPTNYLEKRGMREGIYLEKIVSLINKQYNMDIGFMKKYINQKDFGRILEYIILNSIQYSLSKIDRVFSPFISIAYRDGAPMYTIGGFITGKTNVELNDYCSTKKNYEYIQVPNITIKEKKWIERHKTVLLRELDTRKPYIMDISSEELRQFIKYADQYPIYNEVLV